MTRLRQPTGKAPWPTILLTGEEGSGKTYAALALSASEHVGPTYAFDLGEGVLDQYGPLGPFQIVEHDGTYSDFHAALSEILALPVDPAKPTVVVIDGISLLWTALSAEADTKARRRKSNAEKLRKDPDAEVVIDMGLWNQATDRWYRVIEPLRTWPGIAILTARGADVAVVENGRPVEGRKTFKTQAQKNLPFDVSMVIRTHAPRTAELVKVRSLTVEIPEGGSIPLPDFSLDDLLFTKLGLTADNTEHRASPQLAGDEGWYDEWAERVAKAGSHEQLEELWTEVNEAGKAGKVSPALFEPAKALLAEAASRFGENGLPLNKDGSVSRSRTTEDQRVAAGLMSKDQEKEHAALVADVLADDQKAERSNDASTDDPWAGIPVATPGSAA